MLDCGSHSAVYTEPVLRSEDERLFKEQVLISTRFMRSVSTFQVALPSLCVCLYRYKESRHGCRIHLADALQGRMLLCEATASALALAKSSEADTSPGPSTHRVQQQAISRDAALELQRQLRRLLEFGVKPNIDTSESYTNLAGHGTVSASLLAASAFSVIKVWHLCTHLYLYFTKADWFIDNEFGLLRYMASSRALISSTSASGMPAAD